MELRKVNLKEVADHPAARHPLGFLRYLGRNLAADRCMQTASSLAYTFLLSLVPLTALVFALLAAFPMFRELAEPLNDFIFDNFVPASGEVVREHLTRFAEQTKRLTAIGTVVLIATALMMLRTIDRALNDIWKVRQRRRAVSSFLVYWAVLSLGPVLVGMSLAVTSYLVSLPLLAETAGTLHKPMLAMLPFGLTTVAFTLFYLAIPNRRVPLRHALIGGAMAAGLFEAGKRGFAWYVTNFPTYELIYGALAAIPIFLVWVYLSWLIILLGAEVTYCLATYRSNGAVTGAPERHGFLHAVRLLARLEEGQRRGEALTTRELMRVEPPLHEEEILRVIGRLEEAKWVCRGAEGGYLLARDLDDVTLLDLHRALPWPLPRDDELHDHAPWAKPLAHHLGEGEKALEGALSVKVRELLRGKG